VNSGVSVGIVLHFLQNCVRFLYTAVQSGSYKIIQSDKLLQHIMHGCTLSYGKLFFTKKAKYLIINKR
jgi:hypothetical protein